MNTHIELWLYRDKTRKQIRLAVQPIWIKGTSRGMLLFGDHSFRQTLAESPTHKPSVFDHWKDKINIAIDSRATTLWTAIEDLAAKLGTTINTENLHAETA